MASFSARPEQYLRGAKALDRQLQNLEASVASNVLRGSVRDAMKPALALWRASMREGTRSHKTYKGREVKPGFSRKNSYISTYVDKVKGAIGGFITYRPEAFYNLWFIETTGFQGGRGERGKRKGRKVPPDPKLRPAFKAARGAMLSSLVVALRDRIREAVRTGATSR